MSGELSEPYVVMKHDELTRHRVTAVLKGAGFEINNYFWECIAYLEAQGFVLCEKPDAEIEVFKGYKVDPHGNLKLNADQLFRERCLQMVMDSKVYGAKPVEMAKAIERYISGTKDGV